MSSDIELLAIARLNANNTGGDSDEEMSKELPSTGELIAGAFLLVYNTWINWACISVGVFATLLVSELCLHGAEHLDRDNSSNASTVLAIILETIIFVARWSVTCLLELTGFYFMKDCGLGGGTGAQANVLSAFTQACENAFRYIFISGMLLLLECAGLLLFIVPGIIFILWYGLAGIIAVVDNKSMSMALDISKEYVRGRMLPTLIRYSALAMIWLAPVFLAEMVSFIGVHVLTEFVRIWATSILFPISTAYFYLVYVSVKPAESLASV